MPTLFIEAGYRFRIYVHGHALAHIHVLGHGGAVEVQSELGQGSTFFIWLPIA